MKTHIVNQTKQQLWHNISRPDFFEIQGIWKDLSITRLSYMLTKRTTKTEKIEKSLKMYNINFKNIYHKLTASGRINHLVVNYKFMRPVSILRQPREKKAKTTNSKNWATKMSKPLENELFSEIFSIFNYF